MSNSISRNDPDYWEQMKKIGTKALRAAAGGRPRKIESPAKLWNLACDYFIEVDNTPAEKEDFIKSGEHAGNKVKVRLKRPYTWSGFDRFLFSRGIVAKLEQYKMNARGAYGEYVGVIDKIGQIMYEQKFDGATVGLFNQSVISYDLGFHKEEAKLDRELTVNIVRKAQKATEEDDQGNG